MDFSFTEEQGLIRDTAQSFLAQVSTSEAVRKSMVSELGYDADTWRDSCRQLYWQATMIPEAYGGLGLGCVEMAAMLEQMGRYLFCSPFYSTVCLGANALLIAGTEAQKAQYLPKIVDGVTASFAFAGKSAGRAGGLWGAKAVDLIATAQADGTYQLNGECRYVVDGASAEILVVAARLNENARDQGIRLFIMSADQSGLERQALSTMDQTRKSAELTFNNARVSGEQLMGAADEDASELLEKITNIATIFLAAEQMGGAQQILDLTVEYTKERKQFNRSIASFQAIKHMAADMMTRVEAARSCVYYAACIAEDALAGNASRRELSEAASIAKSYCSDAYFENAANGLQMHGGVGFTWEYDVHLYLKRAKASEHYLGNASYHRERLAQHILSSGERS